MGTTSGSDTSVPTITAAPSTVCTISGNTVSMIKGTGTCTVTATWAANYAYLKSTATAKTIAAKAASIITWPSPAPITYGTKLSATQLDATAADGDNNPIAGNFVYTPAANKVLTTGVQTLSVKFTPTLVSDYTTVTDTTTITVTPVDTTTTITKDTPNPSTVGTAVTVSFTVAQAITNTTKATGTVTVSASSGESCSGALALGKGTCSITFATSGARTLTASYPGDANNNASVSAGFTQTVN